MAASLALNSAAAQASGPAALATPTGVEPLRALPSLQVEPYLGTWFQVGLFPNRFQSQCVSDTTATYRQLPDGALEVTNRCRLANGATDTAVGRAVPVGTLLAGQLSPAQLEVSFLPAALRWLPVGWGAYWVIQRAEDGRYAVVSEPKRQYLWILSRTPTLAPADETAIRSRLAQQGFGDLSRLEMHPHPHAAAR